MGQEKSENSDEVSKKCKKSKDSVVTSSFDKQSRENEKAEIKLKLKKSKSKKSDKRKKNDKSKKENMPEKTDSNDTDQIKEPESVEATH